jgi:hypothetical protein
MVLTLAQALPSAMLSTHHTNQAGMAPLKWNARLRSRTQTRKISEKSERRTNTTGGRDLERKKREGFMPGASVNVSGSSAIVKSQTFSLNSRGRPNSAEVRGLDQPPSKRTTACDLLCPRRGILTASIGQCMSEVQEVLLNGNTWRLSYCLERRKVCKEGKSFISYSDLAVRASCVV